MISIVLQVTPLIWSTSYLQAFLSWKKISSYQCNPYQNKPFHSHGDHSTLLPKDHIVVLEIKKKQLIIFGKTEIMKIKIWHIFIQNLFMFSELIISITRLNFACILRQRQDLRKELICESEFLKKWCNLFLCFQHTSLS